MFLPFPLPLSHITSQTSPLAGSLLVDLSNQLHNPSRLPRQHLLLPRHGADNVVLRPDQRGLAAVVAGRGTSAVDI